MPIVYPLHSGYCNLLKVFLFAKHVLWMTLTNDVLDVLSSGKVRVNTSNDVGIVLSHNLLG